MEHLIRFRTAEGIDGSHVAAQLDEAVAFVERLRNVEGATEVRLYRLTEIPIEFKPYYRVEVGASDTAAEPPPPFATAAEPPPVPGTAASTHGDPGQAFSTEPPGSAAEVPESAAANGRRLFSRG